MLLRKIASLLAGFALGSMPPEAIVMLMEPPPGKGLSPPDMARLPTSAGPPPTSGRVGPVEHRPLRRGTLRRPPRRRGQRVYRGPR